MPASSSHRRRKFASLSLVLAGIVTLFMAGQQLRMSAQLTKVTSGGSVVLNVQEQAEPVIPNVVLKPAPVLHSASPLVASQASAAIQLIVGMLLILLGFFIYALLVMEDEQPVQVTSLRKRAFGNVPAAAKNAPTPQRRRKHLHGQTTKPKKRLEVYWLVSRRSD